MGAIERFPTPLWTGAALLLLVSMWEIKHGYPYRVVDVHRWTLAAAATLLLLPAVFPHGGGLARQLLATRLLTWLGLVSYGIYLWHRPVLDEIDARWFAGVHPTPWVCLEVAAIVVPLTVAGAALSYYVVERPALRLKDRTIRRRAR